MLKVKIKKLRDEAQVPSYAHKGDSGLDVYSTENSVIRPGERKLISTGLVFEIPQGYEGQLRPKSGMALNYGITLLNTPGTLDSPYRGELKIIVINLGNETYEIRRGSKICQIVFSKVEEVEFEETDQLDETTRKEGGFGSTG